MNSTDSTEKLSSLRDMLAEVTRFCHTEGLRVSLAFGSLACAALQGKLPGGWDEASLMMPRPDFLRFLEKFPAGALRCRFGGSRSGRRYFRTYARIEQAGAGKDAPHVDLIPVDGLPNSPIEQEAFIQECQRLRKHLRYSQVPWLPLSLRKPLLTMFTAHRRSPGKWFRKSLGALTRYDMESCLFAGPVAGADGMKQIYPKDMFDRYGTLPLDGEAFPVIEDWDAFLSQQYGDYRNLPPESFRQRES